ncbi:MAG: LptF/LptG family permease [Candidatus Saganbacteria bacterium]|nr:LptF/LptG family permease [Candidatus Saganbacteria bacterium]
MRFPLKFKILDKYVLWELLGPFAVGICGFLMVMITDFLFTYTDLIINKGVPFMAVLKLLLFKIPAILVLTFPVATLFATAMALGRLSFDNEIIALRTSGTSLLRLSLPIFCFSLLVSGASFVLNEKVVPYSNRISEEIVQQVVLQKPILQIRENVFFNDSQNRFYYVKNVDEKNNSMEGIMVYEVGPDLFPRLVLANKGTFKNLLWTLDEGKIHQFDQKGFVEKEIAFSNLKIRVNQDILRPGSQKSTEQMNAAELGKMIADFKNSGLKTSALVVDLYMKYSVPLTCFVFALIGIPLSLVGIRSNRTWGMILCIVLMFTFYVFASVFRSFGRGDFILPFFAAWGPQLLFGGWGAGLLWLKNAR